MALSAFRINSLLELVQQEGVVKIDAHFVYLLDLQGPWTDDLREKTLALLGAEGVFEENGGIFVTPRKGTISPWSSKATDIFKHCGLDAVRRVERGMVLRLEDGDGNLLDQPAAPFFDRMVEGAYHDVSDFFARPDPQPLKMVPLIKEGRSALARANTELGLALNNEEMDYLFDAYQAIQRDPTDVELVMFGQVNSEHCRHKIFNADWKIDGAEQTQTLFEMIRNTHKLTPDHTLVAYRDNAGVAEGFADQWWHVRQNGDYDYGYVEDQIDLVIKVETHNHPTAISPYPGAATGIGGEIRDESATGVGGKSKAGLGAFMVSNLRLPGFAMPWERDYASFPSRLATPLEIMLEGPIGGAHFGNEFGRPQLLGLFKTFEEQYNGRLRGYHKPIMAAGGMGNIRRGLIDKKPITKGSAIVQLGGPAMKIGLGGGAASSMDTGSNTAELDFDSVQRGNAEMERRCQEVIDACIALNEDSPILSIHDIGAGGLSNGCPELVAETGGAFQLRAIHNEDLSMSPMQIWCCEAQERYVLAVAQKDLDRFLALCERERCPAAVIGQATGDGHLVLKDDHFEQTPIDLDLGVLLGKPPRMLRDVAHLEEDHAAFDAAGIELAEAAERVLQLPAVADKTFLITITDRSVTGLVARDQMVGPHQTPVADCAVTATSLRSTHGEAMSMGERTSLAVVNAPASGRVAVAEALTNLAATNIGSLKKVKLSANWMCACGEEGEDANLFDTVKAVGLELCPELGLSIPVGKDSLSMRTVWEEQKQIAPLSLIVSAFAPVEDIRKTVTPDLKPGTSRLILIDLGGGKNRLGGSALAQVYNQVGRDVPDLNQPRDLRLFFDVMQELINDELLLAYHDRSDGGLFVTLCEMAFAGRRGIEVSLDGLGDDALPVLFSEELGAVLQVEEDLADRVLNRLDGLDARIIGHATDETDLIFKLGSEVVLKNSLTHYHRLWSELTYHMQALRDHPECAQQEYDNLLDENDPGLSFSLTYDPAEPFNISEARPKMAILREQGVNGQLEMAAAFERAGFDCFDIHMTDLLSGRQTLDSFAGLVACGGFSYGDVLGAGSGWAKSILYNPRLKDQFFAFFNRPETFSLGVCNGCQMLTQLRGIIPGAEDWPDFLRNRSEQFEARYVSVEVTASSSIFFQDMEGSRIQIPVAHGEGRAEFAEGSLARLEKAGLTALRYVDHQGSASERYPFNPNGSPSGWTGFTSTDGRATILMPHPERGFRSVQLSYTPQGLFKGDEGPWLKIFQNARKFAGMKKSIVIKVIPCAE